MRVMIDVNVEQFSTDDLIEFAAQRGMAGSGRTYSKIIRRLIREYGFRLVDMMQEFVRTRDNNAGTTTKCASCACEGNTAHDMTWSEKTNGWVCCGCYEREGGAE